MEIKAARFWQLVHSGAQLNIEICELKIALHEDEQFEESLMGALAEADRRNAKLTKKLGKKQRRKRGNKN